MTDCKKVVKKEHGVRTVRSGKQGDQNAVIIYKKLRKDQK